MNSHCVAACHLFSSFLVVYFLGYLHFVCRLVVLKLDMLIRMIVVSTGANLEVANHVIISHPYCPPHIQSVASVPLAQAQAFEQQAVGRVLRFPQTKDVFLYRYNKQLY